MILTVVKNVKPNSLFFTLDKQVAYLRTTNNIAIKLNKQKPKNIFMTLNSYCWVNNIKDVKDIRLIEENWNK